MSKQARSDRISPLRRRMIEDMTVRNLSPTTQQSYIHAVKKFSLHFGRSPDRLGLEHVHAYQVHLVAQQVAWSSLPRDNQGETGVLPHVIMFPNV
jgi:integrase/recombinase XerD